jgi:hypothetical protein
MNTTITSRKELLLAKLAGYDVNLDTMTPPVAASLQEKLTLEIADRLDAIDGGVVPRNIVSEEGAFGLRYWNGALQCKVDNQWVTILLGSQTI